MKPFIAAIGLVLITIGGGQPPVAMPAASCESLTTIGLPHTAVTRAQLVPAGQFAATPEGVLAPGAPSFRPYNALPDLCRVTATLTPSADSEIKVEVWMPTSAAWNGKFEAVGNGGWAGQISLQALAGGVGRGYAVAATDTGHSTPGGSFAFGHPEKLTDFAHRAVHEMTTVAKALLAAYYGNGPRLSYWNGCSTGGRQGLMEAQRYPADFDGIIAGAPAADMTHLLTHSIWVAQAAHRPGARLSNEQYTRLHRAVLDACDAHDGVTDGVIEDPTQCGFDPRTIQCEGAVDAAACLTPAQVEAVRAIYSPARNPRTGAEIFPGQERGSEMSWAAGLAGTTPLSIATDYWKYVVFAKPDWDFTTLDFDADVARADALDRGEMNVREPKLEAFARRGGKLLLYHGWNDPLIAPRNTVNYYTAATRSLGASQAADSVRLFMMPGAGHCAGGDGPSNFDQLGVMEEWVEQRRAPTQIVATHVNGSAVDRTRPLCPYPQTAAYRGTGDTNKAENFTCR